MTAWKSQFKHYTGHTQRSLQTPVLDPQEKHMYFMGQHKQKFAIQLLDNKVLKLLILFHDPTSIARFSRESLEQSVKNCCKQNNKN